MPVDPTTALGGVGGPEWQIAAVDAPQAPAQGGGFGDMLGKSLESLAVTQQEAAQGHHREQPQHAEDARRSLVHTGGGTEPPASAAGSGSRATWKKTSSSEPPGAS